MSDSLDGKSLVVVTGMSGAGRSTALAVLEDLGYDAVDNLPLTFLSRLAFSVGEDEKTTKTAIGLDIRSRDFGVAALQSEIRKIQQAFGLKVTTLFLDCSDDALLRRFTETRRRHPLAGDRPVSDGIRSERRAIAPLAESSDIVIDTSDLTIWDFKQRMADLFAASGSPAAAMTVMSFSYRRGVPREADMVIDVRFLKNPHYDPALKDLTGLDDAVGAAIREDADFDGFREDLVTLLRRVLPRYEAEGKSYFTLAFGCTGGRHRSVFLAEQISQWLRDNGRHAYTYHRDLPPTGTDTTLNSDNRKDRA